MRVGKQRPDQRLHRHACHAHAEHLRQKADRQRQQLQLVPHHPLPAAAHGRQRVRIRLLTKDQRGEGIAHAEIQARQEKHRRAEDHQTVDHDLQQHHLPGKGEGIKDAARARSLAAMQAQAVVLVAGEQHEADQACQNAEEGKGKAHAPDRADLLAQQAVRSGADLREQQRNGKIERRRLHAGIAVCAHQRPRLFPDILQVHALLHPAPSLSAAAVLFALILPWEVRSVKRCAESAFFSASGAS